MSKHQNTRTLQLQYMAGCTPIWPTGSVEPRLLQGVYCAMRLLDLLLIFALAIAATSSCPNQDNATPHAVADQSSMLKANVGTVITIPCGDYPENGGITFTYRNNTNSRNGRVLPTHNATAYYRLNVTVYDENTRIVCHPNITGIGDYVYCLDVLCK